MTLLIDYQLFPPIISFIEIVRYKSYKIEQYDNYQKMSYRNRFDILTASGPYPISIPLQGGRGNHGEPMHQITINQEGRWSLEIWRTIEAAYNRSPFFEYYKADLYQILVENQPNKLATLCQQSIQWVFEKMKISIAIEFTDFWEPPNRIDAHQVIDRRNHFQPKNRGQYLLPSYHQNFPGPFKTNLSILDLLFNLGPGTGLEYLLACSAKGLNLGS